MISLYAFLQNLMKWDYKDDISVSYSSIFLTVTETVFVEKLKSNVRDFRYFRYFSSQICIGQQRYYQIRY